MHLKLLLVLPVVPTVLSFSFSFGIKGTHLAFGLVFIQQSLSHSFMHDLGKSNEDLAV